MSECKRCSRCGAIKPLEDFYRDPSRRDGRYPQCKACKIEKVREYYEKNEKNKEKRAAYHREYHTSNREERLRSKREYEQRLKNPLSSNPCRRGAKLVAFVCEVCGKEFRRLKSDVDWQYENRGYLPRFCSLKCMGISRRKDYNSPYSANVARILREHGGR